MKALFPIGAALVVPLAIAASAPGLSSGGIEVPNEFREGDVGGAERMNENFALLASRLEVLDDFLGSILPAPNVITVAPEGADFTSIQEALQSITNSSASEPVVVEVAPATYLESATPIVPPFVRLQGSGARVTTMIVTPTPGVGAALEVRGGGTVADLRIESLGTEDIQVGVVIDDSGVARLERIHVLIQMPGDDNRYGILVKSGGLVLDSSFIEAMGSSDLDAAISVRSGADEIVVRDSTLLARNGPEGTALLCSSADIEIKGSRLYGSLYAIRAGSNSFVQVANSALGAGRSVLIGSLGAQIACAGCELDGRDTTSPPSALRFVNCYRPDLSLIEDGVGSSVE